MGDGARLEGEGTGSLLMGIVLAGTGETLLVIMDINGWMVFFGISEIGTVATCGEGTVATRGVGTMATPDFPGPVRGSLG